MEQVKKHGAGERLYKVFLYVVLITLAVCIIVPVAWVFLASIKQNREFYGNPWALPAGFYWQNFTDAWNAARMGEYMLNSVIVTALALLLLLAVALPAAYCLLDAAGTFADNRVLEILTDRYMNAGMFATLRECADQAAASANCAYELTFLAAAAFCFIYVVIIKKDRLVPKMEAPKYFGAICETAGQFAYIYAISDTAHLAMSAPIISSYCAASVLWSRIFLKEKLSWKHYAMICLVVIGIAIMGFFDL